MSRLNYGAAAAARPAPRFAPKAALRLARCHWRIANIRKDFLLKFTTGISKDHAEIFVEDLNVKGMGRTAVCPGPSTMSIGRSCGGNSSPSLLRDWK